MSRQDISNHSFDQIDFWKEATILAGGLLATLGAILLKIATFFLKKRNDKLDELEKRVGRLENCVARLESCLTVTKFDGSTVPLSLYVQHMSHDFHDADKRYSNVMDIVLTLQKEINGKTS